MTVYRAFHGCYCYFVIAAVLFVLSLMMLNSYQQTGYRFVNKPADTNETLHIKKSTNILSPWSSEQAFKEVKEIFYKLFKRYRHLKKLPLLWKTFGSPETLQGQELHPKCRPDASVLILLRSRPIALNNRNAIRLSWAEMNGQEKKLNESENGRTNFTHQVIFLIFISRSIITKTDETTVAEESKRFGDILLVNYDIGDDETELTTKTLQSLAWIAKECGPKYLLKADDKTFVNVGELTNWLTKIDSNIMYAGSVKGVIRNQGSYTTLHSDYHNPYYTGGWYILGRNTLRNISSASQTIPPIANEDAYIGILADFLGVKRYDNPAWFTPCVFENLGFQSLDPCDWNKKFLIHNVYNARHILLYSATVVSSRLHYLCSKELELAATLSL